MIPRIDLPALIERGRDSAITLDIYSDASVQLSPTAATVVLYDGTEEVVASVAATTVGPPISYTVTAATTASRGLSASWRAVWNVTIAGVDYAIGQPAYLVRHKLYPVVIDDDLTDRHSDLDALRNSAQMTSFEPFRLLAWSRIQRQLIAKGNRPALIMDPFALKDLHVFETLAIAFASIAQSLGDARYATLAQSYREQARAEWSSLVFKYDENEDGRTVPREDRKASPVIYLSPPAKGWYS